MFYALTRKHTSEYLKENINFFISLAPLTQIKHHKSFLLTLFDWVQDEVWWVSEWLGWYEWFGWGDNELMKFTCAIANPICLWSSSLIFDGDTSYEDANRFQVYVAHSYKGVSLKTIDHIAQNAKEGNFRHFDYGKEKN